MQRKAPYPIRKEEYLLTFNADAMVSEKQMLKHVAAYRPLSAAAVEGI